MRWQIESEICMPRWICVLRRPQHGGSKSKLVDCCADVYGFLNSRLKEVQFASSRGAPPAYISSTS